MDYKKFASIQYILVVDVWGKRLTDIDKPNQILNKQSDGNAKTPAKETVNIVCIFAGFSIFTQIAHSVIDMTIQCSPSSSSLSSSSSGSGWRYEALSPEPSMQSGFQSCLTSTNTKAPLQ